MKKALPFILIAGAAIAFLAFRKKGAEPLQLGPGPTALTPRQQAFELGKKAASLAKKVAARAKKAIAARKAAKVGFDDDGVLV